MAQRGEVTCPRALSSEKGVPGSKQTPKGVMGDQETWISQVQKSP